MNRLFLLPLLSPLLLVLIFIPFNLDTKSQLRIFTWKTPSLAIGTLLLMGSTSGVLIGASLQLLIDTKSNQVLKRKVRVSPKDLKFESLIQDEVYQNSHRGEDISNFDKENINNDDMINNQRDIRDPSPTVSVPFRILQEDDTQKYETEEAEEDLNVDLFNREPYNESSYENEIENESISYEDNSDDWNRSNQEDW